MDSTSGLSEARPRSTRLRATRSQVIRVVAFVLAVCSVLPYLVMKVLWLSGSRIGMRPGSGVGEMHDPRFVVGNLISVGFALTAIVFAVALLQPRRRLVPGWLIVILGGGAAGLLAPIALGLPIGVVLQLAVQGSTSTGGEGNLRGAVFNIVYLGFTVLGVCLAVMVAGYVLHGWPELLAVPPRSPADGRLTLAAGIGMLTFAVAMISWGVLGPGQSGPTGFSAIEQRTVLVVTGLLAAAGFITPLLRRRPRVRSHPLLAWALTAVGCTTAAAQGPTLLLLAHGAVVHWPLVAVTLLATPTALLYGVAILRAPDAR